MAGPDMEDPGADPRRMRRARGGRKGGREADESVRAGLAEVTSFSMRVKIEFERIPVFQRRFLNNCWHYTMDISQVDPAEGAKRDARARAGRRVRDEGMMPGGVGPDEARGGMQAPRRTRRTRKKEVSVEDAEGEETVEGRRYVWLDVKCEAFQYTPVLEIIRKRKEKPKEKPKEKRKEKPKMDSTQ